MEWYRQQIGSCTHREFTTGFYFGKPGEESQIYDASTYVKEYTYLGMIQEMCIRDRDYGSKTVGVAISDALGITAQAVETIFRKEENKLRKTCARIEELIREQNVEKIVLGLPKHMNNDMGERAEHALAFGEMLRRRTGLPVVMWDERLTTVEAERTLKEREVRREDRKKYVDQIAAVLILQGYLDSHGSGESLS